MFNALHKKVQEMKTRAEHKFQHQQVRKLIEELIKAFSNNYNVGPKENNDIQI